MLRFPRQLQRYDSAADCCERLAERLENHLRQWLLMPLALRRPLGLATGRTMEPLYAALVRRLMLWSAQDLVELRRRWCSFNLDEYLGVQAGDQCSYSTYMSRHLAEPLQLRPETLHLPNGSAPDGDAAAQSYAAALDACGGVGVQLLGLGSNGHVGFNEPPTAADQACHVVDLSEATRRQNSGLFGGDPAAVPSQAITLGLQEILAADEIHLVVTGAAKADILKRLLTLPAPQPGLPASWLLNHPCVWLWADADAIDRSLASDTAEDRNEH